MHVIYAYIRSTHDGPVQHAMDTEDELEGSVASGVGWHRAGGRGRGRQAGGGRHGAGGDTELEEGELAEEGEFAGAGGRGGRAGGASAARNGHRGQVGGVSAAQSAPCTIKKTEAKSEREWPPAPLPHVTVARALTLTGNCIPECD